MRIGKVLPGAVTFGLSLLLVAGLGPEGTATGPAPARGEALGEVTTPPDVIVFVTDDQRWDEIAQMPTVLSRLAAPGVTFDNALVPTPRCCPSRVSTLRGQYAHTTGIYRNSGSNGGFGAVRKRGLDTSTLATWLDAAGYRTALIGKYLNGYTTTQFQYVPPGWDVWRAFSTSGTVPYYNYPLDVDGTAVQYGAALDDYSTDVLAREAESFIRGTPSDERLFLWFAPAAPHTPITPAPRHAADTRCTARPIPPSQGETDVSDKPTWVQQLAWNPKTSTNAAKTRWIKSCRTLLAVDDAVATVLDALDATGRLENTLLVFMSDNGFLFGEHRYFGKNDPYEEAIRIPLVVRWDAALALEDSPARDSHLVANIDVAPTIVEATGAVPGNTFDGQSLLPLMQGTLTDWRDALLLEHFDPVGKGSVPTFCAVRTAEYTYVRYDPDVEPRYEELYDLLVDPYEMDNLMTGAPSDEVRRLHDELRARLELLCNPPPPNYGF